MRHAWVFLTILGSGTGAVAQDRPGAGEILIESTGPNAHHERRSVPLPPEGPGRDAFLREFVVVDVQSNSPISQPRPRNRPGSGSGSWPEGVWSPPRAWRPGSW